jgi:peptidoglycan/LPS O-acetylase OafA/YrhL
MELLENVFLLIHFLGWAALVGGLVVQFRSEEKCVLPAMRDGVGTAFVAGLVLVGIAEMGTEPVNHIKVAMKFVIGGVILVLVMMNMRQPKIGEKVFYTVLGLTILNMMVAIFWE